MDNDHTQVTRKWSKPHILWLLPLVTLLLILWQIPLVSLAYRQVGMRALLQSIFKDDLLPANYRWPEFASAKAETLDATMWYLKQASGRLDTYRALGLAELVKGNSTGAQRLLRQRLDARPHDVIAHFFFGETYLSQGDLKAAIEQWEEIGAQEQLLHLAQDLIKCEAQVEALESLDAVMRLDPTDFWFLVQLGRSYAALEQWSEAMAVYEQAINIDPTLPNGYVLMGEALYAQEQYEQAIEFYKQALEYPSDNQFWTFVQLGRSYAALEQWSEAMAVYEQAINIDPTLPNGYVLMGEALYNQEQYERATLFFEKALQCTSENPFWTQVWLGHSHAALGQWSEAIEAYEYAIRTDPTHPTPYVLIGDAKCQLGRPEQAFSYYKQAMALDNESHPVQQAVEYIAQHGECPAE